MQDKNGPIPDKDTMCHRTGFTKTCRECVVDHGCRLWKRITLEGDPRLPVGAAQSAIDHYDCVDSLLDIYHRDQLRRQVQTTATVDSLRKEVREANDAGLTHGLLGINQQLRRLSGPDDDLPRSIANGAAPALIEDRRD